MLSVQPPVSSEGGAPVAAAGPRVARVLLDSPLPQLDHLFDYSVPVALRDAVRPGIRVTVPLRTAGRIADAFVVEVTDSAAHTGALSELESVVSSVPVLTPEVWALARRVADRAAGGASDVLRLAIPPRQVRVEKAYLAALEKVAAVEQTGTDAETEADAGTDTDAATDADAGQDTVAATDSGAVEAQDDQQDRPVPQVARVSGYGDDDLDAAVATGERLAVVAIARPVVLASGETVGAWALTVAELARAAVRTGRDAILAVPDFRDQDQLLAALAEIVTDAPVVRLDARQPNPERYRGFLSTLAPGPRVLVGNRSVLYAPSSRLGLLVVVDDGDLQHAEPLSPYVHARDVALVRQEQSGSALVLLAHSRSVEVERLVELGFLRSIVPRPAARPNVIPTTSQSGDDGQGAAARIPSTAWKAARDGLDEGPVLVQVARPGYAPAIACGRCRTVARCTRCEGPLAVRSAGARPSCGWCGLIAVDWRCTVCESTTMRLVTLGAGRTAEELGRAFPGVRVVVSDGSKNLLTVDGTPALVVSTRGAEPRADGGYRAILLLDGERMLARESLRVAEDALRSWSNAAALAAPGAPVMLVGVGGRMATALATWRQPDLARAELADRRALRFPPAVRLASVTGATAVVEAALAGLEGIDHHDVLGPVGVEGERDTIRAIVRFDYSAGAAVADSLRASVVANASRRRRPATGSGNFRAAPKLRVRFDDPEIL